MMQQTETQIENNLSFKTSINEQLVHRWGTFISELILDTPSKFFRTSEIEGFVGYLEVNRVAIVIGEPICAAENKPKLASAFQKFCEEKQLNSIYFLVSEPFAKWAIDHGCHILIEIGEEVIFDPSHDPLEKHQGYKLRNNIHHAQHLGLTVKEYLSFNADIEKAILDLGREWVQARRGPQIYLGKLNFFENRADRRWFYLQDQEQKIIGAALLTNLEACQGWLLKFLITAQNVPRGASELLMVSILETLRNEECDHLTYGMIPSDHLGETIGLNTIETWIAKGGFKIAKWLFHLEQRKTYWQKYHPTTEPTYLLFGNRSIGLKELRALAAVIKMDF
jgi:lysylphosphatidylglycerol synthetase-like protein (DUF2156 family)